MKQTHTQKNTRVQTGREIKTETDYRGDYRVWVKEGMSKG